MTEEFVPEPEDSRPFLDHLEELRMTIFRCVIALTVGVVIAAPLIPVIIGLLKRPLYGIVEDPDLFLRSLQVTGAFSVSMKIAFWGGLILSCPFLLLFVGRFVFPGLTQTEKKAVKSVAALSVGLFFVGITLAYFFTLPMALAMMLKMHGWLGVQAQWTVNSYIGFTLHLLIAFGLAFEMPAIVLLLGRLGIVSSDQLRKKRPIAIIVLLILAAALTPPDVASQLLMAVPLIVLYELCIWLIRLNERKNAANGTKIMNPESRIP